MYSEIKELQRKGFSIRQTASILRISRTTVKKYRDMTLEEYMKTAEIIRKTSRLEEYKTVILVKKMNKLTKMISWRMVIK